MSQMKKYLEAAKQKPVCSDQRFEDLCGWGENEIEDAYADCSYITSKQIRQQAAALVREEGLSKKQKEEYIDRMSYVCDKIESEDEDAWNRANARHKQETNYD